MTGLMFSLPDDHDLKKVIITKDVVENGAVPVKIY